MSSQQIPAAVSACRVSYFGMRKPGRPAGDRTLCETNGPARGYSISRWIAASKGRGERVFAATSSRSSASFLTQVGRRRGGMAMHKHWAARWRDCDLRGAAPENPPNRSARVDNFFCKKRSPCYICSHSPEHPMIARPRRNAVERMRDEGLRRFAHNLRRESIFFIFSLVTH